MSDDIINAIDRLKREKNAVIYAHNYQDPNIQKLGDFVGDSLELAKEANSISSKIIVFAGTEFMAETASILNPLKKVIIPSSHAKCPMAHMLSPNLVRKYKKRHPNAEIAVYVNTTAEIKAMADICFTSGNAVKIIRSLESSEILVGPDKNLVHFIQTRIPEKKIIAIPEEGDCYVHRKITENDIIRLKQKYPEADVLVHPEADQSVQKLADDICSTSKMIKNVQNSSNTYFIIATEIGLIDRLRREYPKKVFIPARNDAICSEQKEITIYSIYLSLLTEQIEIKIPKKIAKKAYLSLRRMLDLSV